MQDKELKIRTLYFNNPKVKKAWVNIQQALDSIDTHPFNFIAAEIEFVEAMTNVTLDDGEDSLGQDNFNIAIEYLKQKSTIYASYDKVKKAHLIAIEFLNYRNWVFSNKAKNSLSPVLYKIFRKPQTEAEFTWHNFFSFLANAFPKIAYYFATNEGVDVQDAETSDWKFAAEFIDCFSEDYFLNTTFEFINDLYDYLLRCATEDIFDNSRHIINLILLKIDQLLFARDCPPIDRFIDLALFAQNSEGPKELQQVVERLIAKIPAMNSNSTKMNQTSNPELVEKTPLEITQEKFRQNHIFYHQLRLRPFKSDMSNEEIRQRVKEIPERAEKRLREEMSFDSNDGFSEDYFLDTTFKFINDLCDYVLKYPEENIFHDNQHTIGKILQKIDQLLFARDRSPIDRFIDLATYAQKKNSKYYGELHDMVEKFIAKIPTMKVEVANINHTSHSGLKVKATLEMTEEKFRQNEIFYNRLRARSFKSQMSNEEIRQRVMGIPEMVKKHLDKEVSPSFFCKFINWFKSFFISCHPLRKEIRKLKETEKMLREMPNEDRSMVIQRV